MDTFFSTMAQCPIVEYALNMYPTEYRISFKSYQGHAYPTQGILHLLCMGNFIYSKTARVLDIYCSESTGILHCRGQPCTGLPVKHHFTLPVKTCSSAASWPRRRVSGSANEQSGGFLPLHMSYLYSSLLSKSFSKNLSKLTFQIRAEVHSTRSLWQRFTFPSRCAAACEISCSLDCTASFMLLQ